MRKIIDETRIQALSTAWHNIEEWDHWLSHQQTAEAQIEVDKTTEPAQLEMETAAKETSLPLVVARNGSRLPFATVDELDRGDHVVTLTHS